MKKYESYKDSGIEWLGEIPEHWDIVPLKYNLSLKARVGWKGLKSDEFEKSSYAYLVTGKDFYNDEIEWAKCYQIGKDRYDEDPYIQLDNGDILITKDGTIGKVAKVKNLTKPACLNSGIFVVKQLKAHYLQDFLYWLFVSNLLSDYNNSLCAGSTIQHLYQNVFENMPLVVLPIAEQELIVAFLNDKVGQIDSLISEKEKLADELMQYRSSVISEVVTRGLHPNVVLNDSGVLWLGKVPKSWIKTKLKQICCIHGRIGYRGYTSEDLVPNGEGAITIGGKNITNNVLDLSEVDYISWEKYYESPEIMAHKGDLLLAQRGTLGRVALVKEDIGEATINPSLVLINSISEKITKEYLYYYLVSENVRSLIGLLNTATAVPMISQNQIENIELLLPPLSEQQEIVNYLDEKITKIDATIKELKSQIEDLRNYKTSIICEAVTGKIDLRDWKPN